MALHNGILHNMSHLKPCHSLMHVRNPRNAAGKREKPGGGLFGVRQGRERTWRAYGSVSEQKTWSDGSRQPMGCGRGAAEWEVRGG